MSDAMQEEISALVDGEVPITEIQSAIDALKHDPKLFQCWQRYHLIGDALKNSLPQSLHHDLLRCVSQAIEAEPCHQIHVPRRRTLPTFVRPAIGFALAASVAAVAYLSFGWQQPGGATSGAQQIAAASPSDAYRRVHGAHWDVEQPAVQTKLNQYLANHNEYSNVGGARPGMMPYVRIVDYTQEER